MYGIFSSSCSQYIHTYIHYASEGEDMSSTKGYVGPVQD